MAHMAALRRNLTLLFVLATATSGLTVAYPATARAATTSGGTARPTPPARASVPGTAPVPARGAPAMSISGPLAAPVWPRAADATVDVSSLALGRLDAGVALTDTRSLTPVSGSAVPPA